MADESYQEKTEAPTPRKRQEARDKGQIARSPEVGSALILLAAAATLHVVGGSMAGAVTALFGWSTRAGAVYTLGAAGAAHWLGDIGWRMLAAIMPLFLATAGAGLMAALAQSRGAFSMQPLVPDWGRLAPQKNLKRMFGLRSVVELLKAVLKILVVGYAITRGVEGAWRAIVALPQESPPALVAVVQQQVVRVLFVAGLAFLGLAVADYLYQVWDFERGLRMSREEVKQELKENEGDPMLKTRRRSMGRTLARRNMLLEVPEADVVVTNPTHLAVALRYDTDVAPAPIVLAMGERKVAERIKAIAMEAGVPLVENRPVARALFATGRVGAPIPADLYVAVAEILAFVIRQREGGGGIRA